MKFSLHVQTRITDWQVIKYLEDLGYDAAWVPDTQMMWSDCYATMALAAANTSKIHIGTGVAIAGTRIAPTTAAAIASINAIAPGRIFLGIGTGHTAMRVMGQDPIPIAEFRDYLRVVRDMLQRQGDRLHLSRPHHRHRVAEPRHGLPQHRNPDSDLRGGQWPARAAHRRHLRRRPGVDFQRTAGRARLQPEARQGRRRQGRARPVELSHRDLDQRRDPQGRPEADG
ncbi:MAG: LLM class flavin-dependent oxidoreductase [Proteobacteria bacterium]|nr:LLM class flavin-dependent oxidoreductase [Pseudomonadota bacterium]